MNVPVFCRILGDVRLKDVSSGTLIYNAVNEGLMENEEGFSYEMTGNEMYLHYRELTPQSRILLENTSPLSNEQWRLLVAEIETAAIINATNTSKRTFFSNAWYACVIVFCYMLTAFVFAGYAANLNYNEEPLSSVIFNIFTEVVVSTSQLQMEDIYDSQNPPSE